MPATRSRCATWRPTAEIRGLGSARQLATQQGWKGGSPQARLMEALLKAAPSALWHDKGKTSAAALCPEFRAWHVMIDPLFGITPPEWAEPEPDLELALQYEEKGRESDVASGGREEPDEVENKEDGESGETE